MTTIHTEVHLPDTEAQLRELLDEARILNDPRRMNTNANMDLLILIIRVLEVLISGKAPITKPRKTHHE